MPPVILLVTVKAQPEATKFILFRLIQPLDRATFDRGRELRVFSPCGQSRARSRRRQHTPDRALGRGRVVLLHQLQ